MQSIQKKEVVTVLSIATAIFLLFYFLGTWHFHSELIRETMDQEFVAYLDEAWYSGIITVTMPEQYQNETQKMITIEIAEGQSARLAIYADYIYVENLYEKRNCITGKLLETSSEFYYKRIGPYYVLSVYETDIVEKRIFEEDVKPEEYLCDTNMV